MKTIKERASLAAWQILEEIGISKHSVDRVSEIIAEKIIEQKAIDVDKACDWLDGEYQSLLSLSIRLFSYLFFHRFSKSFFSTFHIWRIS